MNRNRTGRSARINDIQLIEYWVGNEFTTYNDKGEPIDDYYTIVEVSPTDNPQIVISLMGIALADLKEMEIDQ